MQVYPDMNIRFPEAREAELIEHMKSRAQPPWRWEEVPRLLSTARQLCFRRDAVDNYPDCSLFIHRRQAGDWVVVNIVPHFDVNDRRFQLPIEQYVGILNEFEARIAEPAAEAVGGMTSIEAHKQGLEDYFSANSIRLLRLFCTSSNVSTLGSHPSDQQKWMAFLLDVHRSRVNVHPDTFAGLLRSEGWWPEAGIAKLANEYELAMGLLAMADGTEPHFLKGEVL